MVENDIYYGMSPSKVPKTNADYEQKHINIVMCARIVEMSLFHCFRFANSTYMLMHYVKTEWIYYDTRKVMKILNRKHFLSMTLHYILWNEMTIWAGNFTALCLSLANIYHIISSQRFEHFICAQSYINCLYYFFKR